MTVSSTPNRFPYGQRRNYPTKHNQRELKAIETAVKAVKADADETFGEAPMFTAAVGYGSPTGTTGDTNLMKTEQYAWEYHIKGAGQTIVAPVWSSAGLDIGLDQADDEGMELTMGITSRCKRAFTIGTDEPFFAEASFSIADVSGTDDCAFGFRKAAAYAANIDDYTDMAALNVISGTVTIETILNNAATTSTSTGVTTTDGATVTLRVEVDKNGRCRWFVNGTESTAASFTFDSGDVVVPFLFFLNSADLAGAVNLKTWKVGRLYK